MEGVVNPATVKGTVEVAVRAVALLLLAACSGPEDPGAVEYAFLDWTVDVPAPPEGGFQFRSPVIELPAFVEAQLCHFGTYEGPDVGVTYMAQYTDPRITHHAGPMGVYDDQYPDGQTVDCLQQGWDDMPVYAAMFGLVGTEMEGGEPPTEDISGGFNVVNLPPGVAFFLESGQRYTLDLHYLNFKDQPVRTNTVYNFDAVPVEDVEAFAGAVMFDAGPVYVPPGEYVQSFDCEWEGTYNVLSVMGHMHSYGARYLVEHIKADGSSTIIYDDDDWTAAHAEWPDLYAFEPGELVVESGDVFRTTCHWDNPTTEELVPFSEMCTTDMVVYPLDRPLTCIDGVYYDY